MKSPDYHRGYAAGRKRKKVDISNEVRQKRLDEKYNRAFLAALPICMDATQMWTRGGKKMETLSERASVAAEIASIAVEYMR